MNTTELAKDVGYGGASAIGGVLLYITENPDLSLVIFGVSIVPVIFRMWHSVKKRKEEEERHRAEMKIIELEEKLKQKQLDHED